MDILSALNTEASKLRRQLDTLNSAIKASVTQQRASAHAQSQLVGNLFSSFGIQIVVALAYATLAFLFELA